MRLNTSAAIASLASLALLSAGCSAFGGGTDDGTTRVSAAFYPLAYVAERVTAGTDTEVDLLTQPGKEPHDLELDVAETARIVKADLVVFQSGFQPAVDDTIAQNAEGEQLDAADVVDLLAVDESAADHEEHGDDVHGDDEHEDDEHEGEEHDHGDVDPHFWQDPLRMAELGDAMAEELAKIDADEAEAYRDNAASLRTDLEALDQAYADGLVSCERDTIVVSHDAFGYLEKYGLHIASIVGLSPDAEPTGAAIGQLQQLIRTEGITTVFSEPLEPALGKGLATDLDLTNGTLDPLEGLTADAPPGSDYLSVMDTNLASLTSANGCR